MTLVPAPILRTCPPPCASAGNAMPAAIASPARRFIIRTPFPIPAACSLDLVPVIVERLVSQVHPGLVLLGQIRRLERNPLEVSQLSRNRFPFDPLVERHF